jgi:enterochelin esterase-like enzyme
MPLAASPRRFAVGLLAAAWLAVGLWGAFTYVHDYVRYRGFEPPRDPPGVAPGTVERVRFYSPALGAWKYYIIYLPPGYAQAAARGVRYPVLYLLHGGPSIPEDYVRVGAVPVTYDVELAAHRVRPMLIVMPYGRVHGGPPDTEWSNTRIGRYEDLVLDAVHEVDRRWPTLADRRHRMLAGFSTGGYAAANISLHHPADFGSFLSWSGYFVEDRSEAFRHEPQENLVRNSPALYVDSMRAVLRRDPMTGFAYQGLSDHEKTGLLAFAERFRQAGGHVTVALYPGKHSWRLWRWRMKYQLRYASQVLGGPVERRRRRAAPA